MIASPNQTVPEAMPTAAARRAWLWPAMVIGLILMNACIAGTTLFFALSDGSAAVEPDYYALALKYEDVVRQRGENARLGWRVDARGVRTQPGGDLALVVTLSTRDGVPLDGAQVRATAFASVRASERAAMSFEPVAGVPGAYRAPVKSTLAGQWRVRLHVARGPDTFTHECDADVASPAPPPARPLPR